MKNSFIQPSFVEVSPNEPQELIYKSDLKCLMQVIFTE